MPVHQPFENFGASFAAAPTWFVYDLMPAFVAHRQGEIVAQTSLFTLNCDRRRDILPLVAPAMSTQTPEAC